MVTEEKLFKNIPSEIGAAWMVMYLSEQQFSPLHIKILKSKINVSDEVLSKILNIAPKTFMNYRKDVSNVRMDVKEHVVMLLSLAKHGVEVFGSSADFNSWLEMPNVFLAHKKPLDFLNTINGIRLIGDRLTALEYGDNV
ncbi:MbcA/ParS/Xre antitoxin family protein [Sinomicrobium kalidii]|uniref:antitoxin Xre/MbcA/ParS toxin-binding domain-containing protein n=1 Tax=Sinomicrobium kalidii TaxID=2900738 RepID=UPI001E43A7C1|nr:MbcA/ParS/Xre antitoxin family protein [Sinomicrobium kalidii]UGU14204.1 MbcA/ParS/Xre antitoxin family protein [Sinomicrobium kalidii]